MEKSLIRYIWRNTWRQQLWILLVVAVSMIPYFLSFDLPKRIINGPIQGNGFDDTQDRQKFFHLSYDIPLAGHVELTDGIELDRFQMLAALSLTFLALVVLNGLSKLYINTFKGRLGERMLRRIRFQLVDRVLRLAPIHFKQLKPTEVATMIKDEVEPLGGFTGDAFVQPAMLGGQALTTLVFIFLQNLWLGLITAAIATLQVGVIPRMRKRVLELARQRQMTARELSWRVSEIVDGIGAIHGNDTSNLERADIAWRLGRIFSIRYDLYYWKFLIKFINNFLSQLTPFLFYAVGGYFALLGRLDIGQLVAVIAAYKDLPGPLKEIIDWDQTRQDVQLKYADVYEHFSVEPVLADTVQAIPTDAVAPMRSAIVVSNLSVQDDSRAKLLEGLSTEIETDETVAIVGAAGSGADTFAEVLGRFIWPETGQILIDGCNLLDLPQSVTGRRMAYASAEPFILHGTLGDNLLYGLKHAPMEDDRKARSSHYERYAAEARKAGNPVFDINSDWVDYEAAGARGPEDILKLITPVLDAVQFSEDVFELTLRSSLDLQTHASIAQHVVQLRRAFRDRLEAGGLHELVVPFDFEHYNVQATVSENLLFGTPAPSVADDRDVTDHPTFRQALSDTGVDTDLYVTGLAIAENTIELFHGLPEHHSFFDQLTFMKPGEIPTYHMMLQRLRGKRPDEISSDDRAAMIRLSFSYVEPAHRLGLLSPHLGNRIVAARKRLHALMPDNIANLVERYDPQQPISSASLIDNVLFGRVAFQIAEASAQIRAIIKDIFRAFDLYDDALSIGLVFDVGVGGKRLTMAQRQKINLARALLKRPDYLILNRPLSALDHGMQKQIVQRIVSDRAAQQRPFSIVWVLSNPHLAALFDRVLVFHRGKLVGSGSYSEISRTDAVFRELTS